MIRRFFLVVSCVFIMYGCGSNSSKNTISKKWVDSGIGGFSNVSLYVPEKKSSIGSGRSLMVVLHGCMQSASAFKSANLDIVAEKYGMVIALPDAEYPTDLGCWDFLDKNKLRTKGDYENILGMVRRLLERGDLDIDKDQVYIAGLSSGGSFTMITGCLAPDVFAGVAVYAAPSGGVKTEESAMEVQSDAQTAAAHCIQYANTHRDSFSTQLFVVAHGTDDTIVNEEYLDINAGAMARVYGVSEKTTAKAIGGGASEHIYKENRIAKLSLKGIPHEWAAGKGASGAFINSDEFNFGMYIADFFSVNNMRKP